MSYLQQQMQYLKFDKRLLEINFKKGVITQEDYKKHLEALNNDEDNAMAIDLGGDAVDKADSLGAGAASETTQEAPVMPANNDPFGSGF